MEFNISPPLSPSLVIGSPVHGDVSAGHVRQQSSYTAGISPTRSYPSASYGPITPFSYHGGSPAKARKEAELSVAARVFENTLSEAAAQRGVNANAAENFNIAGQGDDVFAPQQAVTLYYPAQQADAVHQRARSSASVAQYTASSAQASNYSTGYSSVYGSNYGSPKHTQSRPNHLETLAFVPEACFVEEYAARKGYEDKHKADDRISANPYQNNRTLDQVWAHQYEQGRESVRDPKSLAPPSTGLDYSKPAPTWPALINPYTQTPETPNGVYDAAYTTSALTSALAAMSESIKHILKRQHQHGPYSVDIPAPMIAALDDFPHLKHQYSVLKDKASIARTGRVPDGFQGAARDVEAEKGVERARRLAAERARRVAEERAAEREFLANAAAAGAYNAYGAAYGYIW
ncbi:hypothetical protein EJ04DRAFT_574360 [Polyplosphaeria fusca]|uniref:Uncharacterized protein n=1 Tax=Polyplosphaeria fusca TaxID=682080 RepID=A0A9P4R369_9PLEO|nr:hypothetical protein EJ04DRAFT_574360 [Polyplosphaeria fusca]